MSNYSGAVAAPLFGTKSRRSDSTRIARLRYFCAVCLLWRVFGFNEVRAQLTELIPVPGRIGAENYGTNGSGISYYDVSSGNNGGVWPDWASAYQLHTATNLSAPVVWVAVTNEPVVQSGHLTLTVPVDSSNRFFRLVGP